MLPKKNRLKKTKDIDRVFKDGKGYREGFLFLKLVKNNLDVFRIAFIVSKKVASKSNVRNKIKRMLREAVGARLSEIKTGFDAVVVALIGARKNNFQETSRAINKIFNKTKLI